MDLLISTNPCSVYKITLPKEKQKNVLGDVIGKKRGLMKEGDYEGNLLDTAMDDNDQNMNLNA